jgi:hypothetical protein
MDENATNLPCSVSPALSFRVVAKCGRARSSRMKLPHFDCETPMFMPVGTQGAARTLSTILSNRFTDLLRICRLCERADKQATGGIELSRDSWKYISLGE